MPFALRGYQADLIDKTRRALSHHRRVLMQLPTGGGKTVIAATMLGNTAERGGSAWFIVHRKELVDQTSRTLEQVGIPHGFVAAGRPPTYHMPVLVCSVQTLARRIDRIIAKYGAPSLVVWDEAHHCAAGTWRTVADACPQAFHVGLTATPQRLDGKGLNGMFNALVPGPSMTWLIEEGFLAPYRVFTHDAPDLSGLRNRGADFDMSDAGKLMSESVIVGDAVEHYREICPGAQAVAFCCNIEHAIATRDAFLAGGVVAEELDGNATPQHRQDVVRAFRRGEIRVLTSVDLFGEGFDLPELTASILLRPTQSLGLYMQQVGRCLRTAPGKREAIILDHAGNIDRHGLPCAERSWSLAGRPKRTGTAPTKTCGNCFAQVAAAVPACPCCGHKFEGEPREINEVEGRLVELDVAAMRRDRKKEEAMCKTFEELQALGRARGYKPGWARFRWEARLRRTGS